MDAALGLGDRDPLDLVRAALVAQLGEHTRAADAENRQPAAALLGSLDVDLLDRPPLDGGEPLVHGDDVASPDRGLVAADPGPDLDDDRAHGAIVGSHQLALHRFDHLLRPRPQLGQLLSGELGQLRIGFIGEHLFELASLTRGGQVLPVGRDDRLDCRPLDRQLAHAAMVGMRLGLGQQRAQLLELVAELVELADQVLRRIGRVVADHGLAVPQRATYSRPGIVPGPSVGIAYLLLAFFALEVVAGVLLLELLDPPRRVHEGLLACEERMRPRPDLHGQLRHRGPGGHHDLAAVVDLAVGVILGMDAIFHGSGSGPWCRRPKQ
jgi:hypothetical protein